MRGDKDTSLITNELVGITEGEVMLEGFSHVSHRPFPPAPGLRPRRLSIPGFWSPQFRFLVCSCADPETTEPGSCLSRRPLATAGASPVRWRGRSPRPFPHQLRRHRQMIRDLDRPGARGADLPAVVGEDVVDLLLPARKGRTDRLRGELRGVFVAEGLHLRRIRMRVEVAGEDVGIAAGADLSRETVQLLRTDRRVEPAPRRQVRDEEADRGPIDADRRLEERPRLSDARQRMRLGLHDLAAGEDRVAVAAAPLLITRREIAVQAGARLQLGELIAKARLPGLPMHFLQGYDVRMEALDRAGDLPHMIAVDQLIVARDVVGHDDERPALRRKTDALRKADGHAVLVPRQEAQVRIDRPWTALAGTDGVDGQETIEKDQQEDGEHAEDQFSLREHHGVQRVTNSPWAKAA